jgi:hypothetical protein
MRKTPVVLGLLSIIFGTIVAVLSLLAMGMGSFIEKLSQFAASVPGQSEMQRAQLEASQASFAHMTSYLVVSSVFYVVMSISLVVVGVGLYRRRAWGRRAAVGWAIVGLALVVASFVFTVAWLQPHQLQWQREAYAARGLTPPFELAGAGGATLAFFGHLMYCAFPIVLLALIGRRSAANDFLPPASSSTRAR